MNHKLLLIFFFSSHVEEISWINPAVPSLQTRDAIVWLILPALFDSILSSCLFPEPLFAPVDWATPVALLNFRLIGLFPLYFSLFSSFRLETSHRDHLSFPMAAVFHFLFFLFGWMSPFVRKEKRFPETRVSPLFHFFFATSLSLTHSVDHCHSSALTPVHTPADP